MKRIVSLTSLAAVCAILAVGTPRLVQADDTSARDIVVESAKKVKNKDSKLKISVWSDREDNTYELGDEASFFFKAAQDSYVTLFNIGTSGKVTVLYPNKWSKDNFVRSGRVYKVPPKNAGYTFKMSGPAGTEVLKAIVTKEKHDFRDVMRETGDFYAPKDDGASFIERDIVPTLKKKNKSEWGEYTKLISTVADRRARPDRTTRDEDEDEDVSAQAFDVNLWSDRDSYRKGDQASFFVRCNDDCYLTLVDFSTSGDVRILFPNQHDSKNYLKAGKTYRIPGRDAKEGYKIQGPAGTEVIRAIATREDVPIFGARFAYESGPYESWDRDAAARDIQIVEDKGKAKPSDFAEAVLEIDIR
jgi:hypothetical protein